MTREVRRRTPWMEQYRFFFFFFDFFFSRRGDGEGLSELLTEGMKVSNLVFTVRTTSALVFIFSPVSVLVFLFLLATALLGRRIGLIWIFHQPERTKGNRPWVRARNKAGWWRETLTQLVVLFYFLSPKCLIFYCFNLLYTKSSHHIRSSAGLEACVYRSVWTKNDLRNTHAAFCEELLDNSCVCWGLLESCTTLTSSSAIIT